MERMTKRGYIEQAVKEETGMEVTETLFYDDDGKTDGGFVGIYQMEDGRIYYANNAWSGFAEEDASLCNKTVDEMITEYRAAVAELKTYYDTDDEPDDEIDDDDEWRANAPEALYAKKHPM